jgi:hypothetical protein
MGFWLPEAKPKVRKKALSESVGSNAKSMRTCEGAGALTKEQGGNFCSLTACYCVELVSLSEIMPIRPEEGSGWGMGIGLGGSTVNGSINLSQRGGAQIELGTDMGSVNYDSSNGSFGASINDGLIAKKLGYDKSKNPILSKVGLSLGFNSKTGYSTTVNYSVTGKDPNHNPKTFGGLSLTVDRTGTNLGFSASGANLLNSHSVNGFSVNENFISDSIKNRILSRANEEFDAEMGRRLKKQDIEFIKNAKPPVVKEGTDLESLKDEVRQALVHKAATNTNDPDNKAKGTSRLSDSDRSYGEIADGFRNLGAAFGLGNRVSGHSGFVDQFGKFHPRTDYQLY